MLKRPVPEMSVEVILREIRKEVARRKGGRDMGNPIDMPVIMQEQPRLRRVGKGISFRLRRRGIYRLEHVLKGYYKKYLGRFVGLKY